MNIFQVVIFNIGRLDAVPEEENEAFQFGTVPAANRVFLFFRPICFDGHSFRAGCLPIGQAYHLGEVPVLDHRHEIPEAAFF